MKSKKRKKERREKRLQRQLDRQENNNDPKPKRAKKSSECSAPEYSAPESVDLEDLIPTKDVLKSE